MKENFFPVPYAAGYVSEPLPVAGDNSRRRALLEPVAACSPYLADLIRRHPDVVDGYFTRGPEDIADELLAAIPASGPGETGKILRERKRKLALIVALADLEEIWELAEVTGVLSRFADVATESALGALFDQARQKGLLGGKTPGESGVFILGMGKLGSRELNYSSDIDLIVCFDPEKLDYTGPHSAQHFMSRLTQDLVTLLQERTPGGYVFRTDLRLRPDPASTPPAVSVRAAIHYYETVGQNWERAALLKARVIAGDMAAGEAFLRAIRPFLWRRHLDFAAIEDILSIKRQMHGNQQPAIVLAGHNLKTGRGGIREIEFLGQIYQLIWGGRMPTLRIRGTIAILEQLEKENIITADVMYELSESYIFLRRIEHRLQMMADQQTHSYPQAPEEQARLAAFLGYSDVAALESELMATLKAVHGIYMEAFARASPLGHGGRLVFTGVDHDPGTMETLGGMGFKNPEAVSAAVQDWHKGNRRATRTQRSRTILTELMPQLLKELGETAHPDSAFARFDNFMARLPTGVQIFSLFSAYPALMELVADIMGSAPALGDALSANPSLLYAVLTGDFFGKLADGPSLRAELQAIVARDRDEEDTHRALVAFHAEKQFQAGIQLLRGMIGVEEAGQFLSDLAEAVVQAVCIAVDKRFKARYGAQESGRFAVLGLGRLGSREVTFQSDLDLFFLYDAPADSGGELAPGVYYMRLAQRIVGMLSAPGREGRLYEVDTRLRPFGKDGPLAASLEAFRRYYEESAWVFELLALTRSRVIVADTALQAELEQVTETILRRPRDKETLLDAVYAMRKKIDQSYYTSDPWDIKHVWGGLMDADFIIQSLTLRYAEKLEGMALHDGRAVMRTLAEQGHLQREAVEEILQCRALLTGVLFFLRLCGGGSPESGEASEGLRHALTLATASDDFTCLRQRLLDAEATIYRYFSGLEALM